MIPRFHRRSWVEMDGRALRRNYRILRGLVPSSTRLLAVIKANAYGHGLVSMARELEAIGVNWLGVANIKEGAAVRAGGVRLPIMLLSATLADEMEEALEHHLVPVVSRFEEARRLDRIAAKMGRKATVHLKVDTGMGRLGCWHEVAREELARIRRLPNINLEGLCTHFASADDDAAFTRAQWKAIAPLFAENPTLLRHAANSPAVTRRYGYHADMVRAGLALYGIAPNPSDQRLGFEPVLTWKSRIALLHEMPRGRTISYGATYRVRSRERHAVVPMGYGDGYFRLHSNQGHFLVGGKRCPIRGRVTMDQLMIDVTRVPEARVGDEVIALGTQGGREIGVRELAAQARTIPWEIFTNIGVRVPRMYRYFKTVERSG